MVKLPLCRICLDGNVQRTLDDTQLQEIFEKLTAIPFQTNDMRPNTVCCLCYVQLKKCHTLMANCIQAEVLLRSILNQLLSSEDEDPRPTVVNRTGLRLPQLTVTTVQQVSIDSTVDNAVKSEVECKISQKEVDTVKYEDDVKVEIDDIGTTDNGFVNSENDQSHSDSEDDIPLKNIKSTTLKNSKTKKNGVRKKASKNIVVGSVLTYNKDQQIENLLARSKTPNYLNSPFKCELCYKGFVSSKAYSNHKSKHDERNGQYACEICRMRYNSRQQLRTHAVNSHERVFKCEKCGFVSHTHNQARIHEKWHNGFTYECQLCSHKFRKPTSYLSHLRTRHPTEHVCTICGESLVSKHGLQMHNTKAHAHYDYPVNSTEAASERFCTECKIQFQTIDAWKKHILCSVKHRLRNEKSSQCKICGWSCLSADELVLHMKDHARSLRAEDDAQHKRRQVELQLTCQQCGANFISRGRLQAHINRIHLGIKYNKNIVCEVCGKKCISNATLKYHQRTHTGERPYSCTICTKRFADGNQLRIHTRSHTGERPYVCTVCGKRFSQKPALNRHYRIHTGIKPYTCQYCSRTFSQSNSLKLHIRSVHLKQPASKRRQNGISAVEKSIQDADAPKIQEVL